ncbi:long-chain fatty acid-CoA ligase [Globomyces sp. JEL0801]|nr:long-chain fatty acid-CoA ligase [Globomyces sp. JEL0801]
MVLSRSYEVGESTPEHGKARRSYLLPKGDDLIKGPKLHNQPDPNVKTIHDILLQGERLYKNNPCFGSRTLLDTIKEEKEVKKVVGGVETVEKKTWTFSKLSGYEWVTYGDVHKEAIELGAGLIQLGLKKHDNINIFATTSKNWMTMTHACYSQGCTISTSYDNLGADGLAYALNQGEVTTVFTQPDLFKVMKEVAPLVPTLKNIIYTGVAKDSELKSLTDAAPTLKIISQSDLQKLGAANPCPTNPPQPEDLCCIMYTSGSTGNPKGVMLTHSNIIAGVGGAHQYLQHLIQTDDVYLAYLPLAHVLEFIVENTVTFFGARLGYGNPRTLTDASVRDCLGDIKELKPTFMAGVPAVWETIRKGVLAKIALASPVAQFAFKQAFNLKRSLIHAGLPHSFMDKTIFKAIQEGTGGRLKFALSGGAPLASETQEFLTVALAHVIQGYGMTESSGAICLQSLMLDKGIVGTVGSPFPCCEVKLVAVNNYNPNPTDGSRPQGEIWARGAQITKGYYKNPTVTAETITEDGWLKTGDVGEWRSDGSLGIIDRVKNLVKLSHGEYVALEKLEAQYKTSKYVLNMCVHADPIESHIVGLIIPNPVEIANLAKSINIQPDDLTNPELVKLVAADLLECANRGSFKGAEIIKVISLLPGEWTPENGMLTAAQKIKRKEIIAKYSKEVNAMYGRK